MLNDLFHLFPTAENKNRTWKKLEKVKAAK